MTKKTLEPALVVMPLEITCQTTGVVRFVERSKRKLDADVGQDSAYGAVVLKERNTKFVSLNTARQDENSEVLLFGSVAVALMNRPAGIGTGCVKEKAALPDESVEMVVEIKNVRP